MPDNIPEIPADYANWVPQVPAILTSDRLLGDTLEAADITGPLNAGRKALTLRTLFLKTAVEALQISLGALNFATQSDIDTAVAAILNSSPAALDTLNELAAALGDDPNFAATMTALIGNKLDKAGGTLTGDLTVSSANIILAAIAGQNGSFWFRDENGDNKALVYWKRSSNQLILRRYSVLGAVEGELILEADKMLYNGNEVLTVNNAELPTLIIADEKANNTAGQYLPASTWTRRDITVTKFNTITGASLVGHEIILPAGTFKIKGGPGAYRSNGAIARLRDITNDVVVANGSNAYGHSSFNGYSESTFLDRFTLATPATIIVEQIVYTASIVGAALGGIANNNEVETFMKLELTKVA